MLFNNLHDMYNVHYVQATENLEPRIHFLICIVTQPKGIKLSIKMIVEFNIYLISPYQQHILSRSSPLIPCIRLFFVVARE